MSILGTVNASAGSRPVSGVYPSLRVPWEHEDQPRTPYRPMQSWYIDGDSESDSDDGQLEIDRAERRIGRLARQLSQRSGRYSTVTRTPIRHSTATRRSRFSLLAARQSVYSEKEKFENPFLDLPKDSEINPHGSNFQPREWARNLLGIQSRDLERYPKRTAGIAFRNLGVHGYGSPTDYQKDFYNSILSLGGLFRKATGSRKQKIQILQEFDALVKSGEMLVVLGRPGSGCSTLLKTITGETNGLYIDPQSCINYQGISADQMHHQFRGETIYTAETDVHFPQLTVGQTLSFAARARTPANRLPGVSKDQYAAHMTDVVMAMFGLLHTYDTRVGNDVVRGVSGGERKRVSIAEATLSGSPLQCWDNSTRGLDSANALEFCKTLRVQADIMGATACVAIYQSPQSAYDLFDKATVLYEGRQIYFGRTEDAKQFFIDMGFVCPERQTTPDFLTSLTAPEERIIRKGYERRVPRTPDEFAMAWKRSEAYAHLKWEIEEYEREFPIGGSAADKFLASRRQEQSKHQRTKSPYNLSIWEQIGLCISRGFDRVKADMSLVLNMIIGNMVMAVIIGSVFYNMQPVTSSFYSRGALLFFATLLNAFASGLETMTQFAQRPIVEKHSRYALYHPFCESISSIICDLPFKVVNAITFNLILYFMADLRREPGAFFTFLLFSFVTTLTMSMIFRTLGAAARSIALALAPSALVMLGLVIYTGFTIPVSDMPGWSRWINYVDPIAYSFESLMINEFSGRQFNCSQFIPSGGQYDSVPSTGHSCITVGSVAGSNVVDGDQYIEQTYQYFAPHLWRNLGILFCFTGIFCATYLLCSEYITEQRSKGEVLLFRRGHIPAAAKVAAADEESGKRSTRLSSAAQPSQRRQQKYASGMIQQQTSVFHWKDVCYDIKVKGSKSKEPRRLLDCVDGWVKPGTLTALMGVSGAGKTTLLDVLAARATTGVVSGDMLVDGHARDSSFQRKTGYVQQQDLHLATTTVREALRFSALLRQPAATPRADKVAYVEEVIQLLGMAEYADAVVGVAGEGLNVEQRKRLTIGVELAAKPKLLLFLDEPTSGLDSQTSWSILNLLETLARSGQAILCTIHQPSAVLFQRFDRLLFLAEGGRTVYFGDVGANSRELTAYFERYGAGPCPPDANPAEWMLEVTAPRTNTDWPSVWRRSREYRAVKRHLATLEAVPRNTTDQKGAEYREFAAPFVQQLVATAQRVFAQYWRTPSYLWSKAAMCLFTPLFVGFSFFNEPNSQQGLQNQVFAIFMLLNIFATLVQQIMPNFVTQRGLYEARERPAKAYSWQAFMWANIVVEVAWNSLMALLVFFCWYYPIGMYRNAVPTGDVTERGALMFLYVWLFLLFTSTFAHMIIAGTELAETGGALANLLFSMSIIFAGVLAGPAALPGFWIFMYRVSPFTYLISGMLSTGVANAAVHCADNEFLTVQPLGFGGSNDTTCGDYLAPYLQAAGGSLLNPRATADCRVCPISSTNTYLDTFSADFDDRWRNLGILSAYVVFNTLAALALYWLARMPKGSKAKAAKIEENVAKQEGGPQGVEDTREKDSSPRAEGAEKRERRQSRKHDIRAVSHVSVENGRGGRGR